MREVLRKGPAPCGAQLIPSTSTRINSLRSFTLLRLGIASELALLSPCATVKKFVLLLKPISPTKVCPFFYPAMDLDGLKSTSPHAQNIKGCPSTGTPFCWPKNKSTQLDLDGLGWTCRWTVGSIFSSPHGLFAQFCLSPRHTSPCSSICLCHTAS